MAEKKKKDKKWIQGMEMKEGAFTAKAKKRGITTAQLQENVLANPEKYIQTPTQQSVESFDVARTLRQLQQSGRPGEAQAFLDKIMKQRGISGTSGTYSLIS